MLPNGFPGPLAPGSEASHAMCWPCFAVVERRRWPQTEHLQQLALSGSPQTWADFHWLVSLAGKVLNSYIVVLRAHFQSFSLANQELVLSSWLFSQMQLQQESQEPAVCTRHSVLQPCHLADGLAARRGGRWEVRRTDTNRSTINQHDCFPFCEHDTCQGF